MEEEKRTNRPVKHKVIIRRKRTPPAVAVLKVVGTLLLSLLMIIVISGSIFATALTIYILNYADTTTTVNLEENVVTSNVTRFFYRNPDYDPDDEDSEEWLLYYYLRNQQRKSVWVPISQVPVYTQDAMVYTEDERFYSHDGVDFKRTISAIGHTLLGDIQGGSTITQQAIKNATDDDARNGADAVERKIREIFRAINVEKVYTKDDILEAYVNVVEFGTSVDEIIGIQSAANFYFRKDVSELTLAESASLAAMLKEPAGLNPLEHPDKNMDRAQWTLKQMWQNGAISDDERELALKELENLKVYGDPEFSSAEEESDLPEDQGDTDWFMDAALNQAEEYIMEQKGIDVEEARQRLYSGGYDIYTTVDYEMQKEMEKRMREKSNFQEWSFDDDKLESGFCCIDYNGNVLCNVSSRKKKKGSRGFNLVSQGKRSPGSCIKPIASYAPALDLDKITYSSLIEDSPIKVDANSDGVPEDWPVNYTEFGESGNWSHAYLPTWRMIAKSLNTAPARLVDDMSPAYCFNFLREKLDITTLVEGMDNDYSGMTVGGLTDGLHLQELVGAYTIFGNGGRKYNTTYISLMEEADGTVVYEQTDGYKHAINDSTAFIMNKMMQKVVTDTDGTGRYAKLNKTTLAAKTGTSSDWVDLNFVGCTPDYVSGVWIGFDEWKKIPTNQYQNIGAIWKNLFGDIADNGEHRDFQMPDSVYEIKYCTKSGNLASSYCGSVDVGYYKDTYAPPYCNGYH